MSMRENIINVDILVSLHTIIVTKLLNDIEDKKKHGSMPCD